MQNPDFANWLGAYTFPSSSVLVFSCLSILLTSRLLNETMLQECVQTLQIIFPSYPPILSCWPPQPPRVQCSGKGIVDSLPDSQAIANAAQHIETKSASGEGQIVKSSHPTLSPIIMEVENGCICNLTTDWRDPFFNSMEGQSDQAEIVHPTQEENAGGPSQAVLCAEMQRDVLNFRISNIRILKALNSQQ